MLSNNLQQPQYKNIFNSLHSTITDDKIYKKSNNELLLEYYRCKTNIFYFCYNYVFIEHVGTGLDFLFTEKYLHLKFRRTLRSVFHWHNVLLMASRQLGKSSLICGVLIPWTLIFYPRVKVIILNMAKDAAQGNLEKVRYTIEHLPNWMKPKDVSRSKKKTYIEFSNGAKVSTYYYSTTRDPRTLARSLTAPCLYIDEVAFIRHIAEAYKSAQPVLSNARKIAKMNNYPYYIVMTSTPNGVEGDGKFFYDMWQNAVDSDLIFTTKSNSDKYEDIVEQADSIVNDPHCNGFVKVTYHWSEDSSKDEKWYEQQKRELNFDKIAIAQELDLKFTAAKNCIFDSDQLEITRPRPPVFSTRFHLNARLDWFENITKLNKNDFYLIGVDTAWSLSQKSAFPAIEIFSYKNFYQIGELIVKLGSVTKFAKVVEEVFNFIYDNISQRIILCIENNSNGKSIIEYLIEIAEGNYNEYIYYDKKDEPGINTNSKTKELEVAAFLEYYGENPRIIRSRRLLDQMSAVYRTYAGTVKSDSYTDLFMAACFCAYTRKKTHLKILPLLEVSVEEYMKNEEEIIKMNLKMNNPQDYIKYVTVKKQYEEFMDIDFQNIYEKPEKRDDYGEILELYANLINP
jgi:hypothetical protein